MWSDGRQGSTNPCPRGCDPKCKEAIGRSNRGQRAGADTKIRGTEIVPGCVHTEKTLGGVECWVQIAYPIAERNKLIEKLEREADEQPTPPKSEKGIGAANDSTVNAPRGEGGGSEGGVAGDQSTAAGDSKTAARMADASDEGAPREESNSETGTGRRHSRNYPADP